MLKAEQGVECLPLSLSAYCLETKSLDELEVGHLGVAGWPGSKLTGSVCLYPLHFNQMHT